MVKPKTDFTNIRCCLCGQDKLTSKTARREYSKEENGIIRWTCIKCYRTYYTYGTYERPGKFYNEGNVCRRCMEEGKTIEESRLRSENACHEKDKNGNETGEWICANHYRRDYQRYSSNSTNNIIRSISDRRIGNLDPNSPQAKGDKGENLLCEWKGYTNLNKKLDNYTVRRDCLDEKTEEYYQAKIAYYNEKNRYWHQDFRNIQDSVSLGFRFKSLFLFCISEDGKIVERVYEIPEKEANNIAEIKIVKYRKNGLLYEDGWYEKYRLKDENEMKKINEIWKKMLGEEKKN